MKRNLILTGIIIIGGLFSAYNFASLENEAGEAEIKELVEGAPKNVKEGVDKAEAESIKTALEAAGADVELK